MEAVKGYDLLRASVWFYSTYLGGYLMGAGAYQECGELEVENLYAKVIPCPPTANT